MVLTVRPGVNLFHSGPDGLFFYLLLLNRKKLPPALRETNHLYTADWQFLCFLLFLQQLL